MPKPRFPGECRLRVAALLLVCAVSACGTPRSSNLKTEGFYVVYTLETRANGPVKATGVFRDEGQTGDALDLVDGDAAYCDGLLLAKSTTEYGVYEATPAAGKPQYVFELRRPGETPIDKPVPSPRPLRFGVATLDGTYGTTFVLPFAPTPAPAGYQTRYELRAQTNDANCTRGTIATFEGSVAAGFDQRGQIVLEGSTLKSAGSSPGDCHYSIDVVREDTLDVGAPFIGGKLVSRDIESITIHVHP